MKSGLSFFSITNLLAWGLTSGLTVAYFVLFTNPLSVVTLQDMTGAMVIPSFAGIAACLLVSQFVRLWPRFRGSGEGLEFLAGFVLWSNLAALLLWRLSTRSNLAPSPVGVVFLFVVLNLGVAAFVLLWMRFNRREETSRAGWTAHAGLLPFTFATLLFLFHSQIHHHDLGFQAVNVLPFVGALFAVMIGFQVFRTRPRVLGGFVAVQLAGFVVAHLMLGLPDWRLARRTKIQPEARGIQKVILITVDTLRYDSVFGPEHDNAPLAPNLRGLAREGMQFTRATSPAPWTFPSFCSMMSGLEPLVHNKGRQSGRPVPDLLPETVPTLAERFRAKGWLTGAFVYNHFLGVRFGWDRGFDHYLFANCDFVADVVEDALQAAFGEKVEFKSGRDQTSEITRYGIEWIRRHSDNRYFLWLHYLDPHVPYSPPERFVTSASTRDMGLRFDKQRPEWILRPFPPEERAWLRELYEAELRYVDENVGRILDTLRETGQYDDALIVFTSDHGEEFWEHGQFEHGHQLYSELLHIPFVVKLPKGGVTGVFDQTIASPQLHPTVLDLCGLAYDKALFDYPSLRPVWEDGTTTAGLPGPIWSGYMLYGGDKQALTRGRLKLIHDMERDRFELYDLETDPGERNNLAASRPDLLADMRAELEGHVARAIQKRHELGLDVSREVEASPAMLEGLKDLGYM